MSIEEIFEREKDDPFVNYNTIEVRIVEKDHAAVSHDILRNSMNIYGFVHGGLFAAMADNVTALAAHTDGRKYVTQHCNIDYTGNQRDGTVLAEAWVKHRGRTTAIVDFCIRGREDRILVSGRYTLFCIDDGRIG